MTHYVLEKDYLLRESFQARAELIALREGIMQLHGFGGPVALNRDSHVKYKGYELTSDNNSIQGNLKVDYFIKDVLLFKIRIPKKIALSIETKVCDESLEKFVKRFNLREM